uniref:DDE-1 domain-containing protein n=1 Tax=Rousettus aegyptiacus TaxID=9407 RepID=A0A7J8JI04_ROUAE|nr:hypothetical protein HJG63_010322 [Rousettus aegyptiacus]
MKPPYSGNRCLKGLSSVRRPSQCYVSRLVRTVLLWGTVAGYKLKWLVMWHSENTRAFKVISRHILPVYYRIKKKSWMVQRFFPVALLDCYVREMENYFLGNNIAFKIFLIIDDASRYPLFICDLHANIKVVFLPLSFLPPL